MEIRIIPDKVRTQPAVPRISDVPDTTLCQMVPEYQYLVGVKPSEVVRYSKILVQAVSYSLLFCFCTENFVRSDSDRAVQET